MNKNKKLICFIAGPLHIVCLYEFIRKNKIPINQLEIYSIYNPNSFVKEQILNTFYFYGISQFKLLKFSKFKIIKFFQYVFFNIKLKIQNQSSDNLIFLIIDFRNSFLHSLRSLFIKSKFILIDDGSSTYMNYQRYLINGYYLPFHQYQKFIGNLYKYLFFRSNFRRLLYTPFDIYTIYARELNLSNNCLNDLSYLKNRIRKKKQLFNNKLVFFSGTKLSERGAMSLDIEIKLIKNIKNYWKNKNKDMIYVAKRTSSTEKIKLLEKNNISCVSLNLPLEIALSKLKSHEIPKHFCSFGSTLDQTLKMIYPEIKIHLVVFDIEEITDDLKTDLIFSEELTRKSRDMSIIKINL